MYLLRVPRFHSITKTSMPNLNVYELGTVDYEKCFRIQNTLQLARLADEIPDCLILLEHPPTITYAKPVDLKNLLVTESHLQKQGIRLVKTDRGGNITWHEPGQLIGYPILKLTGKDRDLKKLISNYQEVIIRTVAEFSIKAHRDTEHIGVWVGNEKIAAMGVRMKRWVSKHGFSINISSSIAHYSLINPCGIDDRGVTSLSNLVGTEVAVDTVREKVIRHFSSVFALDVEKRPVEEILNLDIEV
jgi:lipoyl(octanoyl) transferase